MRIKVHCQNRVGILRDILNLLVDYGINVNRGEVGGDQGNAIYLLCPNMINLQLHGGYGFMSEYKISRAWVDARVARIYGGTSEIMKEIIGRTL